jgi:hypothetical protein
MPAVLPVKRTLPKLKAMLSERQCVSGSSAAKLTMTPRRRMCSGCCARAGSTNAAVHNQCRRWVIRVEGSRGRPSMHFRCSPKSRRKFDALAFAALCHKLTHAPQQKKHLHSITSSARPRSEIGTVSPNTLAVFKLMTRSTLVTCCTGRSAGCSPLSMRPV